MKLYIVGNSGHGLSVFDSPKILKQIEVVGYCASYPGESMEALEAIFEKYKLNPVCYQNFNQMLLDGKADAVVIDSIFCDHASMAEVALKRGMHVYCEKPLATEWQMFMNLEKSARKAKTRLFAMQSLRYIPWFYTAKKLADEGYIGKLRMLNVQKSYKLGFRPEFYKHRGTYGGTIPWVGIHGIDLILWITGKQVKSIQAFQSRRENFGFGDLEMTAICNFILEDEILANLQADYYRVSQAPSHSDDRLRIVGTGGVIEVRGNKVYVTNEEYYEQEWELQEPPDMFSDFVSYAQGSRTSLLDTEESLYTTKVALLTRESADTGRMLWIGED